MECLRYEKVFKIGSELHTQTKILCVWRDAVGTCSVLPEHGVKAEKIQCFFPLHKYFSSCVLR